MTIIQSIEVVTKMYCMQVEEYNPFPSLTGSPGLGILALHISLHSSIGHYLV